MKKVLGSFLLAAAQLAFAQSARNVGEFSSLKVYDKLNISLIKSDNSRVELEQENPDVETVNKNGELKIRMAPAKILQGGNVSVVVYYENLRDIQASQGSTIVADHDLDSRMLTLVSNEGSVIELPVRTAKLTVKANSAGEIKLNGVADSQDVVVNAGGKYFGEKVNSENVKVTANAGGQAEVNVSGSVDATTRAGGIIDIYGNPEDRKVRNVIGGKITFK
ncbi:DUF2807 domain-containing protein [Chryseobacterium sp. 6424]|uniref:head GIN domain-containing protein n=1 Tax=Chryseobacterium sp. 6424 TaxID=2039166 RepID=UPI000EFB47DA|nr:head GIN domain-containing protein [Chryseobacterium sp. 6424]AYO58272.1 DUF2807 domain-containing protein [Chryseobacterium sp. 6424]